MAQVKMFYRRSEGFFKIENPPSSKRFISTSSHRIWSRLQRVFKIFQLNVSKTSLWCLQTINVLETSSSALSNIWNCNFKHSVKYWLRLEHGFKYAALQRTPWRLVRVPAGVHLFIRPSLHLSVTVLSDYHWQKWCPCKRSRSEDKDKVTEVKK